MNRLPSPVIPPISLWTVMFQDAVQIAIVSYVLNLSIARIIAARHDYQIDANQVWNPFQNSSLTNLSVRSNLIWVGPGMINHLFDIKYRCVELAYVSLFVYFWRISEINFICRLFWRNLYRLIVKYFKKFHLIKILKIFAYASLKSGWFPA